MPTITSTKWELPPHSKAKHIILENYLSAWFPILGMYNSKLNYIDGFCGPGSYKNGEFGSPLIAINKAIKVKNDPARKLGRVNFVFIDSKKRRIEELEKKISTLKISSDFTVHYLRDNFESFINDVLFTDENSSKTLAPTFAFIDPFGISGVTYATIQKILQNKKSEVLVNIMVESANRWIKHPNKNIPTKIELLFGTNEVYKIPLMQKCDRIEEFRKLYLTQIKKCAKYVYDFEMRGKNNNRLYYLFYATNSETGISKMKEACWTVDGVSGNCFSDKKYNSRGKVSPQLSLFSDDFNIYSCLSKIIIEKYSGQNKVVEEIERFVLLETNFLPKHMRATLKTLEEVGKIIVSDTKIDGKKRIKNTFPKEAQITFL